MATFDLSEISGDQIVIHFGGSLNSVDAYTFARSLLAFSDLARTINEIVNPGQTIEIRVEALGQGSFRAVLKKHASGLGGFFSEGFKAVFWTVVGAAIVHYLIDNDPAVTINVNADQVVIERGMDKYIIPRQAYEQSKNVQDNPAVQDSINRTFEAVEADDAVVDFGITSSISDPTPAVKIPREDFPRLATPGRSIIHEDQRRRVRIEPRVRLVILKAWLQGRNKWTFEWNGVPLSARIEDKEFQKQIEGRVHLIGHGDALDVRLEYQQDYDEALGVYVNDTNTFRITRVFAVIQSN